MERTLGSPATEERALGLLAHPTPMAQTLHQYAGPGDNDADAAASRAATSGTFPLFLPGAFDSVGYKDRLMFEDKLTTEAEFKFDGVNSGSAWTRRVERYMVYKAPILKELLEWFEARDGEIISEAHMVAACSRRPPEEQALAVNAQTWVFLSM